MTIHFNFRQILEGRPESLERIIKECNINKEIISKAKTSLKFFGAVVVVLSIFLMFCEKDDYILMGGFYFLASYYLLLFNHKGTSKEVNAFFGILGMGFLLSFWESVAGGLVAIITWDCIAGALVLGQMDGAKNKLKMINIIKEYSDEQKLIISKSKKRYSEVNNYLKEVEKQDRNLQLGELNLINNYS